MNQQGTPEYSNLTDYPDSLSVGNTLFPMLYIYFMGNETRKKKVGNTYKFEQGLNNYLWSLFSGNSSDIKDVTPKCEKFRTLSKKFSMMFDTVCSKNSQWVWILSNSVSKTMNQHLSRLNSDPTKPIQGTYYKQHNPSTGKTECSSLPYINPNSGASVEASMEALRILYENSIIDENYDLDIRPINLYTGSLADEKEGFLRRRTSQTIIGKPTSGIFTLNEREKPQNMYHTFTGIDIDAIASLNSTVSELDLMLSMSWSIHRGTGVGRTLGKPAPAARTGGGRTIAGTMIFAQTDHHPLTAIIPDNYHGRETETINSNDLWVPLMMADEIPPFDIVLVLTNEYGHAAITTFYGVQIVDEGGVYGMDNLVTELALQYTAVAMDPIVDVVLDDTGMIDPFNIMSGGYSKMWDRRNLMASGAGYSALENAWWGSYTITKIRETDASKEIINNQSTDNKYQSR